MGTGFDASAQTVIDELETPGDMTGFVFAFQSGDGVSSTTAFRPGYGEIDAEALLGIQLLTLAGDTGTHPAVIAHVAAEWAIKRSQADAPSLQPDVDPRNGS